jgi:predicted nucleic acid-binding protein
MMSRSRGVCIDASALVDFLLDRPRGVAVAEVLAGIHSVFAPDLINAEVLNAFWRLERTGEISAQRAARAVADLEVSPVERLPTTSMVAAAWSLRDNVTPRDACYVVTARALDVPLLTADRRLARAPRLGVPVITV